MSKHANKAKARRREAYIPKHGADELRNKKQKAGSRSSGSAKTKRRQMNWIERCLTVLAVIGGLALCTAMVFHIKMFPVERTDENGNLYTARISLMEKIRSWKPFVGLDGELESKEYSLAPQSSVVEEGEPFDDGLDLDQIQEGQFTVLFLGLDETRYNTDVMMLAMFDIAANEINILQIPRDSFVPDYTRFEAGKINSVYSMGTSDASNVQRVVDCIEETFQIPIDRYVTTGCNDIVKIVDLIGGVPIDMPYTIYYEPGKTIYKGEQVLSGKQAEWMVRYRHAYNEGDIGRMKAQRIFLAAAMQKVCDIGTIELMGYVDTIIDEELIGSNLSLDEISKLSDFATTIGMEKITMYMLPGEGVNYYPENWKEYRYYSVWSIHKPATIDLLNAHFRPYYEDVDDLPIEELVTEGNYLNTMYDDDSVDFQEIEDGGTFYGK